MRLPMGPERITPTFLIMAAILSSHRAMHSAPALPCINTGRSPLHPASPSSIVTFQACRAPRSAREPLIEICDQAVVGDLENRRVLVLVDRDDHLGVLHAGEMLDRAGDADRDI